MKASFIPYPHLLNTNPLRDFLKREGVDSGRVQDMVAAVKIVVARYAGRDTASNLESLKQHLKDVHDAAEKLAEALQPRQYSNYLWLAIEAAYCANRNGVQTDADAKNAMRLTGQWRDRIGHQSNFLANVALIRDASKEALDRRKRPGRPRADRRGLVRDLMVIWNIGTRENPGASNTTTFKDPTTIFAQFTKLSVQMLPGTGDFEFEKGFAGLLKRATSDVNWAKKPPPKI